MTDSLINSIYCSKVLRIVGPGKLICVPGRVTLSAAIKQDRSIHFSIDKSLLLAKKYARAPIKESPAPVESTQFTLGEEI